MRPHMNLWGAERMMTAACSATFLVSLDTLFHPVQKSSACSRAVWQMQSHWHRGDRTHATLRYPSELVPAVAPAVKCPETSIWNPACYLMCTVDFRTCHCNDGLGRTIHW
ncbi:uncharacterized protein LOC144132515 isoform X10 [Amblyomma americanum]|uniref:Secreted protein n=1 Tax=Amblyomma americanum TaxID=6943 RepID=A0AAQ4ECH7_AMBAM